MYFHFIKHTANASIFQKQDVQNSFKYFLTDLNKFLTSTNIDYSSSNQSNKTNNTPSDISQSLEIKHMSILMSMIIQLHTNDILQLDLHTMQNTLAWFIPSMHTIE